MNAAEKNLLMSLAKQQMNGAILVANSGLTFGLPSAATGMGGAAHLLRTTGLEAEAAEAEARAGECAGIMAVPWPFIYIPLGFWTAAVARLRDGLPSFIDLQPALRMVEDTTRSREQQVAAAQSAWEHLTAEQRKVLGDAGISVEQVRAWGAAPVEPNKGP